MSETREAERCELVKVFVGPNADKAKIDQTYAALVRTENRRYADTNRRTPDFVGNDRRDFAV